MALMTRRFEEASVETDKETLKEEVQRYVKEHTAPYKYPRIVVFREELPKTMVGKVAYRVLEEEEAKKRAEAEAAGRQ